MSTLSINKYGYRDLPNKLKNTLFIFDVLVAVMVISLASIVFLSYLYNDPDITHYHKPADMSRIPFLVLILSINALVAYGMIWVATNIKKSDPMAIMANIIFLFFALITIVCR